MTAQTEAQMAQMQMLLDQLQQANARNETLQTQVLDLNQRMLAADQASQNLHATATSMVSSSEAVVRAFVAGGRSPP